MKLVLGSCLLLLLISCQSGKSYKNLDEFLKEQSGIETTNLDKCIGCSNTFYKQVSRYYIVEINFKNRYLNNSGFIKQDDSNFDVKLWVFKNGDAHINNICTDIVTVYASQPTSKLKLKSGQIKFIHVEDEGMLSENMVNYYFLLDDLIFTDEDGIEIKILDQLFWNVPNYMQLG